MTEHEWLTLGRAALISGYRKKALLALIERGRLPALRRDGKWLVARADLARLAPLTMPSSAPPSSESKDALAEPLRAAQSSTMDLGPLLEALRDRDEQIAQLQEERARMAGQIGFLQGVLVEREARLRLLEAQPARVDPHRARPRGAALHDPPMDSNTAAPGWTAAQDAAPAEGRDGAGPVAPAAGTRNGAPAARAHDQRDAPISGSQSAASRSAVPASGAAVARSSHMASPSAQQHDPFVRPRDAQRATPAAPAPAPQPTPAATPTRRSRVLVVLRRFGRRD
jgi:hypothetical protein